jgi:hypothetical protein
MRRWKACWEKSEGRRRFSKNFSGYLCVQLAKTKNLKPQRAQRHTEQDTEFFKDTN